MYCSNCGTKIKGRSGKCNDCGYKNKSASKHSLLRTFLVTAFILGIALVGRYLWTESLHTAHTHSFANNALSPKESITTVSALKDTNKTPVKGDMNSSPKDVSEIILLSQPKVFTIFTTYSQGSGFLISDSGHVLTNAHVVEGELSPVIRTVDGTEHVGKLVGYSNTTDIAIIKVPALEGMDPLQIEESEGNIGDEVIALGSPRGYENTATLGNISGIDRTFIIPPFEYKGTYQTSAPIAPGSSGGPLLNKMTGKVLGINSARDELETNISFSIPINRVLPTINEWTHSPMSEEAIYAMFYYDNDLLFFNDYLDNYGYFMDDGYYSDEYYEYYEIPFDDNWEEYWSDYWYWEDENDDDYWDEDYDSDVDYNEDNWEFDYDEYDWDTDYDDYDWESDFEEYEWDDEYSDDERDPEFDDYEMDEEYFDE